MELVHLYTRQHENSYYALKNKGRMINKEFYVNLHMRDIAPYFREKYGRFIEMAEKRLVRPSYADYPVWTSVSKKNCLKPVEKELVYCLEVPVDQVLYFDGAKWDYVLNGLYIPDSPEDQKAFEKELKRLNIESQFYIIHGKYSGMYPELEKKIRNSWDRVFTIDEWNPFIVQANLWEIRKEWVMEIIKPGEDLFEKTAYLEETFTTDGPKPIRREKIRSNIFDNL